MLFCKLLLHGVVMGLTGLPNVFADSGHHIHEPVESTHQNPAKSAVIQDANSARLSKAQLRSRSIGYTSFFGGSIAILGALGVAAVYKKNRILSIWHLQLAEGQLRWKGQPVCCHPHEYQTVRPSAQENQVVEALESGTREQLLQEELAEADPLVVKVLEKQALGLEANQTWLRKRTALLALLFGSYVASSIGIPLWNADKVSCANGFFWEDHIPFFCIFMVTKFTELALFVYDPTIQGELGLVDFMIKFVPSFMGYLDGYTDATAIVIARSCESQFAQNLALWMMATYLLGVIVGQWIVLACLATQDPTQACLMKLIHLDALSSCISLSGNSKKIWKIVNMVRTFGEDIPQAICQTLFLIYVKPNYFMILSVAVSIGSSLKALHDALHRGLVGLGVKFDDDEKKLYDIAEGDRFYCPGWGSKTEAVVAMWVNDDLWMRSEGLAASDTDGGRIWKTQNGDGKKLLQGETVSILWDNWDNYDDVRMIDGDTIKIPSRGGHMQTWIRQKYMIEDGDRFHCPGWGGEEEAVVAKWVNSDLWMRSETLTESETDGTKIWKTQDFEGGKLLTGHTVNVLWDNVDIKEFRMVDADTIYRLDANPPHGHMSKWTRLR